MNGVRLVPGNGALRIANSMNLTYLAQSRTERIRNRRRARVVVVAFDPRSLLLRANDRLLEDLIHERARL